MVALFSSRRSRIRRHEGIGDRVDLAGAEVRVLFMAYDAGFQVNTHAIGDAANRMVLYIYSKFLKGKNDRSHKCDQLCCDGS